MRAFALRPSVASTTRRFERVRTPPLRIEIAVLLGVKLLALCVLYFVFFSPAHHAPSDARAVSVHVLKP